MTWEDFSKINVNIHKLEGIYPQIGFKRYYTQGESHSHIIGYVSPISKSEEKSNPLSKLSTAKAGKIGVEKAKDIILRGKLGNKNIEVFFKGFFSNSEIVKNFSIDNISQEQSFLFDNAIKEIKHEINETWKSQNLIDIGAPSFLNIKLDINKKNDLLNLQMALNKIDLIENYYVLELNKNYAKIKIKYLGKIDKMKNKFNNQGINVTISNEEWKLELI